MKNKKIISLILLSSFFLSCKSEPNEELTDVVETNPIEQLKDVDNLLSQLADKPQSYSAPSDTITIVTGDKGTIIHVDPNRLETVDGTPLGQSLDIELIEMVDMASLMFNNTQTVSNGEIIETGGAYYLNMTSDGKQLKMKEGKGLDVEFPNISKKDMEVFMGERDSLGQVNWNATQNDFKPKDIPDAKMKEPIIFSINGMADTIPLTGDDLKKWEERNRKIEYARKTYEAVSLMNFGLCNVDRFLNDSRPKTNIQLVFKNDDRINGARIFAFLESVNSTVSISYWRGQNKNSSFENFPIGEKIKIIAISSQDEKSYISEKTIRIRENMSVELDFKETTPEEIKKKAQELRGIN